MLTETLSAAANGATAIGVCLAAWSLWRDRRQTVTAFEDSFAREYRELAAAIPTTALLGEELTDEESPVGDVIVGMS